MMYVSCMSQSISSSYKFWEKKLPLYLNYSQWVLIINSLVQQTNFETQSATIDWNWVIILWYESHLWGGSWRECCPGHDSSRYNKLGVHATATRQGLNGVWPRLCPDHNHPHLNQTACLQHRALDLKQGWNLKGEMCSVETLAASVGCLASTQTCCWVGLQLQWPRPASMSHHIYWNRNNFSSLESFQLRGNKRKWKDILTGIFLILIHPWQKVLSDRTRCQISSQERTWLICPQLCPSLYDPALT